MGKKQSRRSISIKGPSHARFKVYCDERGEAMSSVTERLIAEALDAAGVPEVHPDDLPKSYPTRTRDRTPDPEVTAQHFSF